MGEDEILSKLMERAKKDLEQVQKDGKIEVMDSNENKIIITVEKGEDGEVRFLFKNNSGIPVYKTETNGKKTEMIPYQEAVYHLARRIYPVDWD